jgi:DnaJ-class molecular chaperone
MPTRRSATACDALALPRRRRAFGSAASRRALCLLFATVTLASVSGAGIEDLLGQMMGGQGGFQQMGGMGGMGGGRRRQREVVEEPEYELDVDEEYEWLAGTTWNWNNWKNVKFEPSGKFDAPDKPCEEGRCTWSARKGKIKILWGNRKRGDAGLHVVTASTMKPEPGTSLSGTRKHDNDPCTATFISKDEIDEEDVEFYLYTLLGLDEDATEKQIKKAYHKLSMRYHPDKNQGETKEEAETMFKKVAKAYEILSNPEMKMIYDMGGMEGVKEYAKEEAGGGGGGGGGMLDMFFGGGGGGGGSGRNSKKGPDAKVEVEVSLEDMYRGNDVSFSINRRVVCRGCSKKSDDPERQKKCEGCSRCPNEVRMKQVQVQPGMFAQQQEEVKSKEKCKDEDTELTLLVEKGTPSGHSQTFTMMSEQVRRMPSIAFTHAEASSFSVIAQPLTSHSRMHACTKQKPGQIPGDVVVEMKQKKHPQFKREGNDLHITMEITLKDALLGFSTVVDHLDDHEVVVTEKGVVSPGQVRKIKGEGMPVHNFPSDLGDLYVTYKVKMPKKISDEARALLEQAAALGAL